MSLHDVSFRDLGVETTELTSKTRRVVAEVSSQLLAPAPLRLAILFDDTHSRADLALNRPDTTAHLALVSLLLDIRRNDESLALHSPLSLSLLDPPDSLAWSTTTTADSLVEALGVTCTAAKDLRDLHHANIGGKCRHLTLVVALVHWCFVVLVVWQLGPETAEDAVACSWDMLSWSSRWC